MNKAHKSIQYVKQVGVLLGCSMVRSIQRSSVEMTEMLIQTYLLDDRRLVAPAVSRNRLLLSRVQRRLLKDHMSIFGMSVIPQLGLLTIATERGWHRNI